MRSIAPLACGGSALTYGADGQRTFLSLSLVLLHISLSLLATSVAGLHAAAMRIAAGFLDFFLSHHLCIRCRG